MGTRSITSPTSFKSHRNTIENDEVDAKGSREDDIDYSEKV